ncbi:MAG: serine/threonine protein kinase [Ruminococcus sp.]|nr:serine/threonine protein kinase [Ruminococcus sp.]
MFVWLEGILKEQYQFIGCLRNTEKTEIIVLEHKTLHKRLIKRTFTGRNDEVYQKLLTLKHKGFPEILEVTESEGKIIVLEEYIDGVTLFDLIQDELYTEKAVIHLVSELCDTLSLLHSYNIIHRDIKPDNIMIDKNQTVKLIDFDSARIYKPYYPRDTEYLGTVGYAAPEQYDTTATDSRADIFAVGVLMNVMLTGKSPSAQLYHGKLQKVIEKCVQISPDKRFQTADELKRSLK